MTLHVDVASVGDRVTWDGVMRAIVDGHLLPTPRLDDVLIERGDDTLLSRVAMIDGLGSLVKTATIFPGNAASAQPTLNGAVTLFSDSTGRLDATLDFHLLTWWKTAADSLLAAVRLAPPEVRSILIVGSGTVAASMIDAYRSVWPQAAIRIWSRTVANARRLAEGSGAAVVDDLESAVRRAQIVSTATMSTTPLLAGEWLHPGQHVDLIGGYRPDMREADDACIRAASVYVDSRRTTADVGDIADPLASGALQSVVADFADLGSGVLTRTSSDEITIFKNAGGAHLDLMVARHLVDLVS